MRKLLTLSLFVVSALIIVLMYDSDSDSLSSVSKEEAGVLKQEFRPAAIRYNMMRANVNTGKVEPEDLRKAKAEVIKHLKDNPEKAGSVIEWEELGPNNIGGRARVIHFDVNDSDIMYTGGITGGLFKSMDAGNNWELMSNSTKIGCTNVSSMTQTDDGTLFVGTGSSFEFIYIDTEANVGSGIFTSSDGGETLEQIPTTSGWSAINRLATSGSRVFAATSSGFFYSDDGFNWSQADGISQTSAQDVHVTSDGKVYVAYGSEVALSTDNGSSFTNIPDSEFDGGSGSRKVIKSCEANPDYVYVAYLKDAQGCNLDIYRTTNGGESFTKIVGSNVGFSPTGFAANGGCQGVYDLTIGVSETDPDQLYIGGLTLWKWTPSTGAYQVDNYGGSVTNETYVHPDKHEIYYKPGSGEQMYIATDGGIYLTNDASSDYPIYQHKSKGLNTVQYYSIDAGIDGSIIGGAQDNGTTFIDYTYNSPQSAIDLLGGDGGYCEISDINPNLMIASSQEGSIRLSTNGGEGFGSFLNGGSACDGQGNPAGCASDGPDEDGDGNMDSGNFIQAIGLWEDVDLYYAVTEEVIPRTDEGEVILPHTLTHNGQTFIFTDDLEFVASQKPGNPGNTTCHPSGNPQTGSNCARSASNYGNYQGGTINVYTANTLYIGYDRETDQVIPSEKFIRSKFVVSNSAGQMWMTYDLHNLSVTPFWVNLGRYHSPTSTAGGSVLAMGFSKTGDDVFFGTTSGRVTRVSGLNDEPQEPVQTTIPGGGVITGIFVNQKYDYPQGIDLSNQVVVTKGGTGSGNHVFISNNATNQDPDYESIQGDLPSFPLYDCVINDGFFTEVIVGGEFGIWFGKEEGGSFTWSQENGIDGSLDLGLIPVERLRYVPMARNNNIADFRVSDYLGCKVLYAGTHGRGAFRSTSFATGNCSEAVALSGFNITNVDEIDNIDFNVNVYPNPSVNEINIDFEVENPLRVKINVFDIQGKLIKQLADIEAVGQESVKADISELSSGNYVVSLATKDGVISKQISVIK